MLATYPPQLVTRCDLSEYSKSPRKRNSIFANQAVQFLVHETVFQIEAGWFLKCHIRNSSFKVFTVKNHSVMLFHYIDKCITVETEHSS